MQSQFIGEIPDMFIENGNLVIDFGDTRMVVPWSVVVPGLHRANRIAESHRVADVVPLFVCRSCGAEH